MYTESVVEKNRGTEKAFYTSYELLTDLNCHSPTILGSKGMYLRAGA